MEITLNTTMMDANAALAAYREYKAGRYREAISGLTEILDVEPSNWQARLLLGVCYMKTQQPLTAQRAFRYVYEKCQESELRKKACLALQVATAEAEHMINKQRGIIDHAGGVRTVSAGSIETIFTDM